MKRFIVVLLFLLFFVSSPVSAQSVTPTDIAPTTVSYTDIDTKETIWDKIWNWITRAFIKNDYTISNRSPKEVSSDFTTYGDINDKEKHLSSGNRLTDSNSQRCYRGNIIKNAVTGDYPDSGLASICSSSNTCTVSTIDASDCKEIKYSDLAAYFIQIDQRFYCDSNTNKLVNTDNEIINKVTEKYPDPIPSTDFDCYKSIYDDIPLAPKENVGEDEENTKKIMNTPLPVSDQDPNDKASEIKKKLNTNLAPKNGSWGNNLNYLRPANWPK